MDIGRGAKAMKASLDLVLPAAGLDLRKAARSVRGLPGFVSQYRAFRSQSVAAGYPVPPVGLLYPIIGEEAQEAGGFDAHYMHQDLWAARKLYDARVVEHFDIGSRVDGFISSALVFSIVNLIDVRPLANPPDGLRFIQGNAMRLPFEDGSLASLSTLHAMEHFGLGRYGDPLDPAGTARGLAEVARVAAPGGRVYIGLPVGTERIMFNAQRIHAPSSVLRMLDPLRLVSFAAVDDAGRFIAEADPADFEGSSYSCGLFEFSKSTV
jgi:SAM-dependent methyltransferase